MLIPPAGSLSIAVGLLTVTIAAGASPQGVPEQVSVYWNKVAAVSRTVVSIEVCPEPPSYARLQFTVSFSRRCGIFNLIMLAW
jgi:hypothetical protein